MEIAGFSYNSRHCSEFGVIARTIDFPVMPEPKNNSLDVPARDGSYSFPARRVYYQDKTIQILCQLSEIDLTALNRKLSVLSKWLAYPGRLKFDALPGVYYDARLSSGISFAPLHTGRGAALTVSFDAFPLAFDDAEQTIIVGAGENLTIQNPGHYAPIVIYAAGGADLSVNIGGDICGYTGAYTALTLDSEAYTATDSGQNVLRNFTGEFLTLPPGGAVVSTNRDITISYRPRYLFGKEG
jgi:phage-related protein